MAGGGPYRILKAIREKSIREEGKTERWSDDVGDAGWRPITESVHSGAYAPILLLALDLKMRRQAQNYPERSSSIRRAERKSVPHELERRVVMVNQHVMVRTYNYDVVPRREVCIFRVRQLPMLVTSRNLG